MAAQRIAARPPSALSGSVGINAISPRRRGGEGRVSRRRRPFAPSHLRSRGVDFAVTHRRRRLPGSSPLTRGRPHPPGRHRRGRGLIPAHAGSTAGCFVGERVRSAHPRSRGVDAIEAGDAGIDEGSSPLTRGRQHARAAHTRRSGLIPAHAGSTVPPPTATR